MKIQLTKIELFFVLLPILGIGHLEAKSPTGHTALRYDDFSYKHISGFVLVKLPPPKIMKFY